MNRSKITIFCNFFHFELRKGSSKNTPSGFQVTESDTHLRQPLKGNHTLAGGEPETDHIQWISSSVKHLLSLRCLAYMESDLRAFAGAPNIIAKAKG